MRINKLATAAFLVFHSSLVGVFFVPISEANLWLLICSYFGRMFFITAGYHRYFSHRAFTTSRPVQFILAFMAQTSSQKGVLWWSAHHRAHHRDSDQDHDVHTPKKGFFWSHCGWFLSADHEKYDAGLVRDLARYPELRWLDRYWSLPVFVFGFALLMFGGWASVFWGLCVGTVLLWHGTFTINSLSHLWGTRRFETADTSKNNPLLAALTLGEGWHNNHHQFPNLARSGFNWWEVDLTYYILKTLAALGLVWNLRSQKSAV